MRMVPQPHDRGNASSHPSHAAAVNPRLSALVGAGLLPRDLDVRLVLALLGTGAANDPGGSHG